MSSIMKGIVDETPAKKGADGKRCWKGKRYAGTVNGKDKCIPVKENHGDVYIGAKVYPKWDQTGEPFEVVRIIDDMTVLVKDDFGNTSEMYDHDLVSAKNEAANPAQQAAIAVNKKKGQKPKHVDEAKAKPYVKPFIENGKQVGWKSSDGYHVKYWQMFAKDSAIKHAKLNPNEVQEDYTGQFAAEKTPAINPYGGLKDNKFRGAIDEAGVKYVVRSKDGVERGYSDPNSIGAQNWKDSYQQKEKPYKPEKIKKPTLDQIWQKVEHAISNYFPDGDPTDYLNPYMQKTGITWDDITRAAKKNGYKDLWDYWNTLTQDIENDAYGDWLATDGKNVRTRGTFMEEPTNNPTGASGEGGMRKYKPKVAGTFKEDLSQADVDGIERFADKLYKKLGIDITFTKHFMDRVNDERNGKPISGAELVRLFKKEYERWGKDVAQMGPDMEGTFKDLTTDINLPFVLRWDRDEKELDLVAKTVMRKKNFKTHNQEFPVDEDTAYAGGMGQGGNAGESYRKFKPKSAGTFKEEQLDEKCWDDYKQVGMKNKGGKQVPNCVPKESAIMKGIKNRLI